MVEQVKMRRFHHVGRSIMWISLMLFVGASLPLWSWNTVVSGIFGLPNMQLKHAVALEVLLGILSFPFLAVRLWITESDFGKKGA